MKPAEMKEIYEDACRTALNRPVPDPVQAKAWLETLGFFDPQDVRGGLSRWWASGATNSDGEVRSKWLPAPAELKPLCEQARLATAAKKTVGERLVRWQCPDCKTVISGFPMSGTSLERRCKSPYKKLDQRKPGDYSLRPGEICGARLTVIFDENADAEPVQRYEAPDWVTR